jgi:uncharacterized protein
MHDRPAQRVQLFELIVLFLFLLPPLVLSLLGRSIGALSFRMLALSSIFQNIGFVALILYFVWRNREPVREIGLTTWNWPREVLAGILLFIPFSLVVAILESMLRMAGLSGAQELPSALLLADSTDYLLALPFLVVVAFAEELLFRGYLLRRLDQLTGSLSAGLLLSSMIFALGHGYAGALGVVTVGAMGMLFGLIYRWRGSLVAPMVMHFIQNFIGLILAPLAKG